jgi:hypothetical protein
MSANYGEPKKQDTGFALDRQYVSGMWRSCALAQECHTKQLSRAWSKVLET